MHALPGCRTRHCSCRALHMTSYLCSFTCSHLFSISFTQRNNSVSVRLLLRAVSFLVPTLTAKKSTPPGSNWAPHGCTLHQRGGCPVRPAWLHRAAGYPYQFPPWADFVFDQRVFYGSAHPPITDLSACMLRTSQPLSERWRIGPARCLRLRSLGNHMRHGSAHRFMGTAREIYHDPVLPLIRCICPS